MGSCKLPYSHGKRQHSPICLMLISKYGFWLTVLWASSFRPCGPASQAQGRMNQRGSWLFQAHRLPATKWQLKQRSRTLCSAALSAWQGRSSWSSEKMGWGSVNKWPSANHGAAWKHELWCFTKWRLLAIKWWRKQPLTLPNRMAGLLPLPCAAAWGKGWASSPVRCFCHPVAPPLSEMFCVCWQCPVLWYSRTELPSYLLVVAKLNSVELHPAPRFSHLPASLVSIGPYRPGRHLPPQYCHPHCRLRYGRWKQKMCPFLGNKTQCICASQGAIADSASEKICHLGLDV